jgi:hypothetical protein
MGMYRKLVLLPLKREEKGKKIEKEKEGGETRVTRACEFM